MLGPFRRVAGWLRIARHLALYPLPGEQRTCPACGQRDIEHLEPLISKRKRWRFGFITGCRRCGVLFANPLPSDGELHQTYSAEGDWGRGRQEEREPPVSKGRLAAMFAPLAPTLDVLRPPAGASVLDVGCGAGGLLDTLASAGWRTAGIDPATKVAFTRHRELEAIPATAEFDLLVLHHVLEHVTTPSEILREAARAVRVGGYLMIGVPNVDQVAESGDLDYRIRASVHVLAYSSTCLAWLVAEAGFAVVNSELGPAGLHRRVVLARRTDGPIPRPPSPLRTARQALDRYRLGHPSGEPGWLTHMPVRTRAAYLGLSRSHWRLPG